MLAKVTDLRVGARSPVFSCGRFVAKAWNSAIPPRKKACTHVQAFDLLRFSLAPRPGLEPGTYGLTEPSPTLSLLGYHEGALEDSAGYRRSASGSVLMSNRVCGGVSPCLYVCRQTASRDATMMPTGCGTKLRQGGFDGVGQVQGMRCRGEHFGYGVSKVRRTRAQRGQDRHVIDTIPVDSSEDRDRTGRRLGRLSNGKRDEFEDKRNFG